MAPRAANRQRSRHTLVMPATSMLIAVSTASVCSAWLLPTPVLPLSPSLPAAPATRGRLFEEFAVTTKMAMHSQVWKRREVWKGNCTLNTV